MRLAAWLAIALGSAGASGAAAQSLVPDTLRAALNDAAFAPHDRGLTDTFHDTPGKGPALKLAPPSFEPDGADVAVVRIWPRAVSFASDTLDFDISPHAGFGVSRFGGQAEGGATLTVSRSRSERAAEGLRDLGVEDGAAYGDKGRWYLFAAASGRAVGLNMLHDARGWDRAGWSTDPTGALVGDAQVGVGWRKGDLQSSFGVIHREVKGRHMIFGQQTRDDTVAAFTFSLRPGH